jgi:hypothetical protein
VVLKLLKLGDVNRKTFGFYNEDPAILNAALRPRSSHLAIKSHVLSPANYELCRTGQIKSVYTWRDPYDVVVSAVRMFGGSPEEWMDPLRNALRVWSFHRETNSAHILAYESIMNHATESIAGIADYLGLSAEPADMCRIAEEMSFKAVRRFSRHVEELDPKRVVRKDRHVFDRETLLHQGHIRNGGSGYGLRALSPAQIDAIDKVLSEEGFDFLRHAACEQLQFAWNLIPAPASSK